MTSLVASDVAVDMTTWAFTPGWRGTSHSDTEFVIEQSTTGKLDTFHGSGFAGFDQFGIPTTGTINGIDFEEDGNFLVSLSDFSITVEQQRAFSNVQDMAGWQNFLFAGDDSFEGSTAGDHLLGLGGNDVFDLTQGGSDTAEGGVGDDEFNMGDEFDADDAIDGGFGFDSLHLDGDYAGGVTFNASTMTNIEFIDGAEGNDYSLTLDDGNVGFGQMLTGDFTALDVNDHLIFDASAETGGNFHVTGGAGDDQILAGAGNDVLNGGTGGLDVLSGGAGNDLLISQAGQADMSGDGGDDTFVIDGGEGGITAADDAHVAGGRAADIQITDTSGHDLLDMRGASSGAVIDMATGGHVAGRTVIIGTGESGSPDDLDLVFSQDLTGSFGEDLANVQSFLPEIFDAVLGVQPDTQFGVTSFLDKGEPGSYATNLGLTADTDAVQSAYDALTIGGGGDVPEDQLEALQQLGLRGEEVGWNEGSLHVVVMFTDAIFHIAGEGPPTPNNGDTDLDPNEDYPTIAEVRDALLSEDIIPIFAVTSDVIATYEDLVEQLGFGAVVELAGDSSNVVDAVTQSLDLAVNPTLIEDAQGTDFDDTIIGNNAGNVIFGNGGDDTIEGGLGNDTLRGNEGRDHINGGAGDDRIIGGNGRDVLDGGTGSDTFHFFEDSGEKRNTDTIVGFNSQRDDKIDIDMHVNAVEDTIFGSGDLEDLASELGVQNAVLVVRSNPGDRGDHAGRSKEFLIINTNGEVGYQQGHDLLIRMSHSVDLDHLSAQDFV